MHVVITRVEAESGRESALERELGPGGDRATRLGASPAFLGSEILRSADGSYLLVERWASRAAYRGVEPELRDDLDGHRSRAVEELTSLGRSGREG